MSKLNLLGAWNGGLEKFFAGNSAQSFMRSGLTAMAAGGSCGSSCGAGDGAGNGGDEKEETRNISRADKLCRSNGVGMFPSYAGARSGMT